MFNIEFKITGNEVVQTSTFIPRNDQVRFAVYLDEKRVRNLRLLVNHNDYYMLREKPNTYYIDICRNMISGGTFDFSFIKEYNTKEKETNSLNISLTQNNIIQEDHTDLNTLIYKMNQIMTTLLPKEGD